MIRWFSGNFPEISLKFSDTPPSQSPSPLTPPPPGTSNPFFSIQLCCVFPQIPLFPRRSSKKIHFRSKCRKVRFTTYQIHIHVHTHHHIIQEKYLCFIQVVGSQSTGLKMVLDDGRITTIFSDIARRRSSKYRALQQLPVPKINYTGFWKSTNLCIVDFW